MAWPNEYLDRLAREAYEDRMWWSEFEEVIETGKAKEHFKTLPVLTNPDENT